MHGRLITAYCIPMLANTKVSIFFTVRDDGLLKGLAICRQYPEIV